MCDRELYANYTTTPPTDLTINNPINQCIQSTISSGVIVPGLKEATIDSPSLEQQSYFLSYCSQNDSFYAPFCRESLIVYCSQYTKDDTVNPYIRQICGCYLPDSAYDPTVGRVCDTICLSADVIKYVDSGSTVTSRCGGGICVIDNTTITISDSNVGNINFNQACPSCGPYPCRCVISDINIIVGNSSVGSLNLTQNCPAGSTCYATADDGSQTQVDCSTYFAAMDSNSSSSLSTNLDASTSTNPETQAQNQFIIWLVITFVLFIIFLVSLVKVKEQIPEIYGQKISISSPKSIST